MPLVQVLTVSHAVPYALKSPFGLFLQKVEHTLVPSATLRSTGYQSER